ncbi:MAG: class I SAM-dependent RNA methyltransferase [Eubacteriales bacterium]|nr:class I SAM-dependent RNA methyltransferase [Eubacteriales bacterium]
MKTDRVILTAPCHFGTEAVLKREIQDLGYDIVTVEDGRVTFSGDRQAICYSNIFLRTAERILWRLDSFEARSFEELFTAVKAFAWERILPKDAKFWVAKVSSVKSKLFSPSDIQSIVKKAMVERMKAFYGLDYFPETGAQFPLRIFIMKERVEIGLDTTGLSLHKRGYRLHAGGAPIKETLAAALIMLTPWRENRHLVDPFCGSGTFLIEAAMIGANLMPGLKRSFLAEEWTHIISPQLWEDVREDARSLATPDVELSLQGYDIDDEVIKIARENAKRAGVDHLIHFQCRGIDRLSHPKSYGFVITNPPYGERLEEKEALPALYREIGKAMDRLPTWSFYLITGYDQTQQGIGKQAAKNRKIYNGMLQTYFYQYPGPKPPKKEER